MAEQFKRYTAYKMKIGQILSGTQIMENERLKAIEIDNSQISRVNLIANVVDKYIQEGEKKFGSLTLDDGSGQIRVKNFGEEVEKLNTFALGDTLLVIGLLRIWSNELYITPEIIKKKDTSYLLLRKIEIEANAPKTLSKDALLALKDKIILMLKEAEKDNGIDIDKIILQLKEAPDIINKEIKRLIEDGIAFEPRPGRLRYLG